MWKILTLVFIVSFSSCMSTGLVDQEQLLNNSNPMKVVGRTPMPFLEHKMSFGEYYTNRIPSKYYTSSNVSVFGVNLSEDSSKVNYSLFNSKKEPLDVICRYKGDQLGVSIEETYLHVDDEISYQIDISSPKGLNASLNYTGYSYTPFYVGNEEYILIRDKSHDNRKGNFFTGYLFVKDDKTLAAVDTNGSGVVWVDNNLAEDEKHILAGFSSALLLRDSVKSEKS